MTKAVALFSGGLDSILAIKIVEKQGIEITPVSFYHPFSGTLDERSCQDLSKQPVIIDISDDFFKILKNPVFGYGKNLNPCMDCRILYFKKAKEFMKEIGADFLISGEVVGQRPFSQRREAIRTIEKEAGVEGLVVRPLTQKNMPETIPEQRGLIDREKLLDIKGRNRQIQLKLAKEFALNYIPTPAGGCLLTLSDFSYRTKELMKRELLTKTNVEILKYGRFFPLTELSILIIGRNERENKELERLFSPKKNLMYIETLEPPGPSAIIIGKPEKEKALQLIKRYIKNHNQEPKFIIKS